MAYYRRMLENDMSEPILYMAPIQGITGATYRNVYSGLFNGYDYAVVPFIASRRGNTVKNRIMRDILPERNDVRFELIPQILSKAPKDFIVLAKAMFDFGYETVNWNLGCPLAKVRNKGRGSGLLPYLEKIVEFLNEVILEIPNELSIKVRLGSENRKDLSKLLPLLNDMPIKEIIIHPRTGKQMYAGEVDIDSVEECISLTKHSVVYSGDIDSLEKYEELAKRFPMIKRWMIGRGGVINPFLPEEIKNITCNTDQEKLDRFLRFHDAFFAVQQKELSGPSHILSKMKEYWRYWVKAFEGGDRLFLTISRIKTVDKYLFEVEKFFVKSF